MTAQRSGFGYALVITGALLFIMNAGVSRVVMRSGIEPTAFTTVRISGAAIIFVLWAALGGRHALKPPRGRAIIDVFMLGLIGVAALQLSYNIAINRLPVGIALLLEYLAPVIVVLWVRFARGEAVQQRMWVAVIATVAGIIAVSRFWQGIDFDALGVLAGLCAAVSLATYFLLGEHNVATLDPLRVILWTFLVGALLMNVVWPPWAASGWFNQTSLLGIFHYAQAPVWALMIFVVACGTVAPFFLQLWALRFVPAAAVTVIATLEPVGALILGWLWFGEALAAIQLAGAGVVLLGIVLAQTARVRPHEDIPVID